MIYLAYIIYVFSIIQLLIALVNFLFGHSYSYQNKNFSEFISILIPARDEEKNIATLLHDIQQQDYQNFEIIVFNDQSTDKTASIVEQFAQFDSRIKLVNSSTLPEGWLGKNFACFSMSKLAKGSFFLFLDADVRIGNNIFINTVSYMKKHKLGLLSIFPKQEMETIGEQITVPNMNYILLSLLPLILVRKLKNESLAAANGQFMLFDSKIYAETKPHEIMRENKVEDIAIARFYKKNNISIACLTGDNSISCRMYENFNDAVAGFSKNVICFFGNSYIVSTLFWVVTTFGIFIVWSQLSSIYAALYLVAIVATRVLISIVSKQNIFLNLLYLVPQQFAMGLFIYKSLINKYKKQYQWKGRNIS